MNATRKKIKRKQWSLSTTISALSKPSSTNETTDLQTPASKRTKRSPRGEEGMPGCGPQCCVLMCSFMHVLLVFVGYSPFFFFK